MGKPRAVDLFCGAGGLTLGLKKAGFKVLGALDVDETALESFRKNHKTVRTWQDDIRKLPAARVRSALNLKRGELELLAGCPPCQAFSALTTLNGKKNIRTRDKDLLFEFLRFVRAFWPKTVLLENVPGLGSDPRMSRFKAALVKLGYEVKHRIVNAADFGVAQRRKRLLLVATRVGTVTFAAPRASKVTVREVIGRLPKPGNSGDPLHDFPESRSPRMVRLISRIPRDGGSRRDSGLRQLSCHKKCHGFFDVYGRMSWDQVAPTITSGCANPSKGRFLHPSQNRCITLREAALLQSFPADYFFSTKRGKFDVARMIGNALPPELVRNQATAIRQSLTAN